MANRPLLNETMSDGSRLFLQLPQTYPPRACCGKLFISAECLPTLRIGLGYGRDVDRFLLQGLEVQYPQTI